MNLTRVWVTSYKFKDVELRVSFQDRHFGVEIRGLDRRSFVDSLRKMADLVEGDLVLLESENSQKSPLPVTCLRCDGTMAEGVAIQETLTGVPDFPGGAVATVSPGGPGRLVSCLKCVKCGYSLSVGSNTKES